MAFFTLLHITRNQGRPAFLLNTTATTCTVRWIRSIHRHHGQNTTFLSRIRPSLAFSTSSTNAKPSTPLPAVAAEEKQVNDFYNHERVQSMVGHNFPDFIEWWSRDNFRRVGYGLSTMTAFLAAAPTLWSEWTHHPVNYVPAMVAGILTAGYWRVGQLDMQQSSHAIRRNYPVLGNLRYLFETIRPELHQYIVESDTAGRPFDRLHRTQIYQRAKNVNDTMSFGTRRNVYDVHHDWACHSMWPEHVNVNDPAAMRRTVGCADFGTTRPYSASVLNISGMSYGAISDHAIWALSRGAQYGGFYHNTGEGGVSQFHIEGGGDLVWNIGTGYFGCGTGVGEHRVFEPALFQETMRSANGQIKMIEIKLSQGAKPGHGGLLPKAKITQKIAFARKLEYPAKGDCHSPARHSSFSNAHELVHFIARVRELSEGIPVGIKLCAGRPGDVAALCKASVEIGNGPDFISVDGAEGGTGAAPPELSNSVGLPLEEGLVMVRNMLIGAGLRDKIIINSMGRVSNGFAIVRCLALGSDITAAARAFMISLGCIQALKCNTNKCPTGVATLDPKLMYGLDPMLKSTRVFNFHRKTVESAADIVGILGKTSFSQVNGNDVMRRVSSTEVRTLAEQFPEVEPGSLLNGKSSERMQQIWNSCGSDHFSTKRWIY